MSATPADRFADAVAGDTGTDGAVGAADAELGGAAGADLDSAAGAGGTDMDGAGSALDVDSDGAVDVDADGDAAAGDGDGDAAAGDAAAGDAEVETDAELPDVTGDETLDAAIEALLLVVDTPASEELLANTLDQPVTRITEALHRLSAGYADAGRGIDLRRVGEGWRFYTRDVFAPYVEKMLLDGQRAKLTRAALETLAVVAYRQPVTRARVAAVRGVNVDGVVRTLLARGLIEETGTDQDTGGTLYRTTELFLERLGLSSLDELPALAPLLPEVDAIDDV